MNCADVERALARGERPEGPKLTVHLRACDACTELLADDGRLGLALARLRAPERDEAPSDETFRSMERALSQERGATAALGSLPTAARIALALGATAVVAMSVLAFRGRPDLEVYPLGRLIAAVGAYSLLVVAALRVALRPLHVSALPLGYRLAVAMAAVVVPFLIAAAPAAHGHHPTSLGGIGADLAARALQCFAFGSAVALPMLALFWALDRGRHGAWPGALSAAGAAGLTGILALELHCPLTHPAHLVVGHATVGSVLLFVYGGVTWLRRRAAARGG